MIAAVYLSVGGMTCGSCSSTIDRHLKNIPGIESVHVNILLHEVIVMLNSSSKLEPDDIADQINMLGFDASIRHSLQLPSDFKELFESRFGIDRSYSCDLLNVCALVESLPSVKHVGLGYGDHQLLVVHDRRILPTEVICAAISEYTKSSIECLGSKQKTMSDDYHHLPIGTMEIEIRDLNVDDGPELVDCLSEFKFSREGILDIITHSPIKKKFRKSMALGLTVCYNYKEIGSRDIYRAIAEFTKSVNNSANVKILSNDEIKTQIESHNDKLESTLVNALLATLPSAVVLWITMSPYSELPTLFKFDVLPGFSLASLILLALTSFIQFYCGRGIHKRAWKHSSITMDTFISFNTTVLWAFAVILLILNVIAESPNRIDQLFAEKQEDYVPFPDHHINDTGGLLPKTLPTGLIPQLGRTTRMLAGKLILLTDMEEMPHFLETGALLISVILWGKTIELMAKRRTLRALNNLNRTRSENAVIVRAVKIWGHKQTDNFIISDMHRDLAPNYPHHFVRSWRTNESSMSSYTLNRLTSAQMKHAIIDCTMDSMSFRIFVYEGVSVVKEKNANRHVEFDLVDSPTALLQIGDLVLVDQDEKVPADGILISAMGNVQVDESFITGESIPVTKNEGDRIYEGSIMYNGCVILVVTELCQGTVLGQVIKTVRNTPFMKTRSTELADKISRWFLPVALGLAVLTWTVWSILVATGIAVVPDSKNGEFLVKFMFVTKFGIAVLAVACPCALGLATPTAITVAIGQATKFGCLIKNGEALEVAANAKKIVLDKTGTLTSGRPIVTSVFVEAQQMRNLIVRIFGNLSGLKTPPRRKPGSPRSVSTNIPVSNFDSMAAGDEIAVDIPLSSSSAAPTYSGNDGEQGDGLFWAIVKKMEMGVKHPVAEALRAYENMEDDMWNNVLVFDEVRTVGGRGVMAKVRASGGEGVSLYLGSVPFYESIGVVNDVGREWMEKESELYTVVVLFLGNGTLLGAVKLRDELLPGSVEAVCQLKDKLNLEVWMCTGDHESVAERVALEVGIENVCAGASPQRKLELVERLKMDGGVIMVGDGSNDSLALITSCVGVSLGADADIMAAAADVVITRRDLGSLLSFLRLSRACRRTICRNFIWAFVFNVLGMPMAAGVFYPWLTLSPLLAGLVMAGSSILVVVNSLLLQDMLIFKWLWRKTISSW